jgi:DNA-binding response OmpR family regulator
MHDSRHIMNILLIEDDRDLGETITQILEENQFLVEWVRDGAEGLYLATEMDYNLIILDRLLPELDGIQVLAELRKTSEVPVLMLTALNQLEDRIEGLDAGADDYLGKPFELSELLARVRALLRRGSRPIQEQIQHKDILLEPMARRISRNGRPIKLSKTEYRAVEYMLLNRGRVITREALERMFYEDKDISGNPVDVLIHRIRGKLGHSFIQTKRGLGFIVEKPRA